ncbi:hypothetical protein IEQ34_015775 [Dendrobium chrysotoxum]|uniref:Uncharacterized protein n=1 Tax=Dendrobium chrysotoxum TaxID=161865 RepID=A0AAV7GJ60_DENCH|nr:hypothetical protein IEQ34_015775 [Dendrobium chrysotoxum]
MEATTLMTMIPPKTLSIVGSVWFSNNTFFGTSGYDDTIELDRRDLTYVMSLLKTFWLLVKSVTNIKEEKAPRRIIDLGLFMGCVSSSISFLLDSCYTLRGYKKRNEGLAMLSSGMRMKFHTNPNTKPKAKRLGTSIGLIFWDNGDSKNMLDDPCILVQGVDSRSYDIIPCGNHRNLIELSKEGSQDQLQLKPAQDRVSLFMDDRDIILDDQEILRSSSISCPDDLSCLLDEIPRLH